MFVGALAALLLGGAATGVLAEDGAPEGVTVAGYEITPEVDDPTTDPGTTPGDNLLDGDSPTFDDGGDTAGTVDDDGGLDVMVQDASDPGQGVQITTTGDGVATFTFGGFSLRVDGDSIVIVTVGSIHVSVIEGSAQLPLADGTVVTIPAGAILVVDELADGTFSIVSDDASTADAILEDEGAETVIQPGTAETVEIPAQFLSVIAGGQFAQWSFSDSTAQQAFGTTLKIAWLFNTASLSWTSYVPALGISDFPLTAGDVLWLVAFSDTALAIT